MGRENPGIVVLEADLGKSTMSCYFEESFPGRFFEMGIAEANMTSFAAGLSLAGKIPFTNSFAVFAAGRAYDQIRQGVAIAGLNVKIVGSSAGLSDYGDGSTHQAVEDIAIMRAIPNMTVLVPADGNETRKMTRAMAAAFGPMYMRLNRDDLTDVTPADGIYEIGRPLLVRDGGDAVVFACGLMVSRGLEAAGALAARGVSLRVVNVSTLKPADDEAIRSFASGLKAVVTAEEHSLIGGLSAVVAEAMKGIGIPTASVGIADRFGQSARSYDELLNAYGLTAGHIEAAVQDCLGRTARRNG
jgi:transketolase